MKYILIGDESRISESLPQNQIWRCMNVMDAMQVIAAAVTPSTGGSGEKEHSFQEFVFLVESGSGESLVHELKVLRAAVGAVPIVVVGRFARRDYGVEVLRAGADDFLRLEELNDRGLWRSITHALERARARGEFLRASLQAQQAVEAKSAFLANMSHEIRTPLNLIIGTADLLNETSLTDQQKKLVSTFATASDHLLTLLSNVLDLSRLETRGLHCVDARFDVSEVFFEACNLASVLCRAKRVQFDYLLGPDLPMACIGDKLRVRQVLLNLLNNAIKFTDRGRIELRLELAVKSESGVELAVTVTDTGRGMSDQDLKNAFQYFYQGDRGLERMYPGSGLGLAMVKAVADHYHGHVQIQSQPGHGTSVCARLKLRVEGEFHAGAQDQVLEGTRILVVSANRFEGTTICTQLQKHGALAESIESGKEALLRLNSDQRIDYALLDVQTSDIGGLQLLSQTGIRFARDRSAVLLPALHRNRDVAECLSLGGRYLYKPFSVGKFLELFGKAPPERHREADQDSSAPSVGPLSILVVDDDQDNRELVAAYLALTSHAVKFAKDGKEALALADVQRFDLVLMDIEMPGMNGYEVARRLKEISSFGACKIMGLSANAFPHDVMQAKIAGFAGYLTKPVRKQILLDSIAGCILSDSFFEPASAKADA